MKKIFTMLCTLCALNAFAQIPTNGLVAYYPFNGNANDASGNGNNGTVNGATLTTDRFGNANSAYSFNGGNDIAINPANFPNGTKPVSVSLWFKSNSSQTESIGGCLFSYGAASNNSAFGVFAKNNVDSSNIWFSSWNPTFNGKKKEVLGKWNNVTLSYDGVRLKAYYNGVKDIDTVYSFQTVNSSSFIGKWVNGTIHFKGEIDDIAIYNRALTSQEIAQLYCSPTTSTTSKTACGSYTWNQVKYTQSGTYTKTGLINDKGCDSTATLNLTINPIPAKPSIGSFTPKICLGTPGTMTTAEVATTYTWKRNEEVVGTTQNINIQNGGAYYLTVGNQFGCENHSDSVLVLSYLPASKPVISGNSSFCVGNNTTLSTNFKSSTYSWKLGNTSVGTNNKQLLVNTAGTYSLTVLDSNSCIVISDNITVTANPLPTVSLNALPSQITINSNNVTLVGSPSGGTYSGKGVSGNIFNPKTGGLGTRTIAYSYTNGNGCSNNAIQKTLVYDTLGTTCSVKDTLYIRTLATGVNNIFTENTIKIYPNPASNFLIIDNGNFGLQSSYKIEVVNPLAQTLFSSFINQQQFTIDISSWTKNSIYIVRILNPQGAVIDTRKVVVQ